MKHRISKFELADYLDSEEMIGEYIKAVLEEKDRALLASAFAEIAKIQGDELPRKCV